MQLRSNRTSLSRRIHPARSQKKNRLGELVPLAE
jgi:hypothetical protein